MARGRSGALFSPRLVMKQSKRLIWPFAVSMALAGEGPAAAPNFQELPLTAQSRSLPSDFKDHFFDVPLAVCMERNSKRDRVVTDEVMQKMAERLRPPTFKEGFEKITVVRVKGHAGAATEQGGAEADPEAAQ